jgi:hypothetical protein
MLLNPLGFTYYYLEGFSFYYYIAMQSIINDNVSIKCYYYVWNNYNLLQYSVGYYTLENQANINKWLLYICFNFVFGVTLTSNNITFGVMLCNRLFIFGRPIKCKKTKYIGQWDNISWCVLSCNISKFSKLIDAD